MSDPNANAAAYWKRNIRLVLILMSIWFIVSFGFGIILRDLLDNIQFFGFRLGFWFAQQGSIYSFLVLIGIYVWQMNKIDREFDVHEE